MRDEPAEVLIVGAGPVGLAAAIGFGRRGIRLAPVIREALMQVFEKLANGRRHTIILVEQHVRVALDFADRAILLDKGRVIFDGDVTMLKQDPGMLHRHVGLDLV